MKKVFNEYGTVIVVVTVVVALIGLVAFLMQPDGIIDKGFDSIVQSADDNAEKVQSPLNPKGRIPEGARYIEYVNGYFDEDFMTWTYDDVVTYGPGERFPNTVKFGDIYVYGDYEYCYGYYFCIDCYGWSNCGEREPGTFNGWGVHCTKDVSEPGAILESINGEPITCMYGTFLEYGLEVAPAIPASVTDISMAFCNCYRLVTAPKVPSSVVVMDYAFSDCRSLTGVVMIDANPTSFLRCFSEVDFSAQALALAGSSDMLDALGATGKNY